MTDGRHRVSFHVAEGGLDIPFDKKAVPKITFARLLEKALQPPADLMELPFTSSQQDKARTFVSLMLKPTVCPEVPGFIEEKLMEVRFFAPGNLVSNLDFVESIFGNGGRSQPVGKMIQPLIPSTGPVTQAV